MIAIKGKQSYLVALESVAMTDIVLNMFIFFFISFSIIYTFNPDRVSKIDVRLPAASSAVAPEGTAKSVLAITGDGIFYLNDEQVAVGALKRALSEAAARQADFALLLKIDRDARFGAVAAALDAVHELGIARVSVATVQKRTDGGSR